MITRKEWEAHPEWQRAHEDYLESIPGQAFMDVIAAHFMAEPTAVAHNANVIEITAIVGAECNGYKRCYNNIQSLMQTAVVKRQSERDKRDAPEFVHVEGTTLPITKSVADKINNDRRYAQSKTK